MSAGFIPVANANIGLLRRNKETLFYQVIGAGENCSRNG
jgi:hypothetical protein